MPGKNIINNPVIQERILNNDLNPCPVRCKMVKVHLIQKRTRAQLCKSSTLGRYPGWTSCSQPLCKHTVNPQLFCIQGELPNNCVCTNPSHIQSILYLIHPISNPSYIQSILYLPQQGELPSNCVCTNGNSFQPSNFLDLNQVEIYQPLFKNLTWHDASINNQNDLGII